MSVRDHTFKTSDGTGGGGVGGISDVIRRRNRERGRGWSHVPTSDSKKIKPGKKNSAQRGWEHGHCLFQNRNTPKTSFNTHTHTHTHTHP